VKTFIDEAGNMEMRNESKTRKTYTPMLTFDARTVPSEPPEAAPKYEELTSDLQEVVGELRKCFEQRPIWTRRALTNTINRNEWRHLYKYCYEHVGYMFRSGPWREAVVKLGVDPRADPRYRVYQTMMFQLEDNTKATQMSPKYKPTVRGGARERKVDSTTASSLPKISHIFDGKSVVLDGRVWQVCDITEPLLKDLLSTSMVRRICHVSP
jgi:general transcription factor 3C polypeptide 5 (transcription factor C subunit 1)